MSNISANDLKVKGVASIEAGLADSSEAIISVRGRKRFVVMDVAHYEYLRECELEAALSHSRDDMNAGRFVIETPEEHLARLERSL